MSSKQQETFMNLIQLNEGILHKIVGLYTNDLESKKDLHQEILLQTWRSYKNFRGDSKFSTWLYKVALNCALTQSRKNKKNPASENLENVLETNIETQQKEDYEILYVLIKKLNEIDRMLMTLHMDGYNHSEIAEISGMTPNNVSVRLHRVKNNIIEKYKKYQP